MRKVFGVMGALALALLLAGPALSRQAAKCPMAVKQPGKYCEKCAMVIEAKDQKAGKCGKDESALVAVQVCVKEHFICGCGKSCCTDDKDKAGNCKCGKPLKKETNNSLIVNTCAGCSASSPISKDKVVHKDDCKKKDVKTSCTH